MLPHRIQFRVTERTLKAFLNTYNRRNRRKTMKKIGFIGVGIMGKVHGQKSYESGI